MCRKMLLVCVVLMTVVAVQSVDFGAVVDCDKTNSVYAGTQKCLELYDIPITLPDPDIMANSSTDAILTILRQVNSNTTATMCRPENRENYISATLCIYNIIKKCLADNPVRVSLIPSPEKLRQQIQFQCNTLGEFNQDCVISKMKEIQECLNTSSFSIGESDTNATDTDRVSRAMCVSFELSRVCARKHLKSCGDATLQMYEQNLPDVDVCKNYTDSNPDTDGEMKVDCSSTWGVRKSYLTCQVNSGVFLQLPEMDSSDEISEYILKTVIIENSHQTCRNLSEYSDLINCTLSVQRKCRPDSLKSTVPDTQSVLKGFQQLCKNINSFDSECVLASTDSACSGRKRRSLSDRSILNHLCVDTRDHNRCLSDRVKACGDETQIQYNNILSAQLPLMCLTIDTPVKENSAFKPTVSVIILIISAILLH